MPEEKVSDAETITEEIEAAFFRYDRNSAKLIEFITWEHIGKIVAGDHAEVCISFHDGSRVTLFPGDYLACTMFGFHKVPDTFVRTKGWK